MIMAHFSLVLVGIVIVHASGNMVLPNKLLPEICREGHQVIAPLDLRAAPTARERGGDALRHAGCAQSLACAQR